MIELIKLSQNGLKDFVKIKIVFQDSPGKMVKTLVWNHSTRIDLS